MTEGGRATNAIKILFKSSFHQNPVSESTIINPLSFPSYKVVIKSGFAVGERDGNDKIGCQSMSAFECKQS